MRGANCLPFVGGVVLVLLATVACGGDGQTVSSVGPQASPTEPAFGSTPMPVSREEALWDWITDNSVECEPILRPTYLPSTLTRVSLHYVDQQRGCVLFGIEYSNDIGNATLLLDVGPFPNPPLPASDTVSESVEVRGNVAGYELYHLAEPRGLAFVACNEPGQWGNPDDGWQRDWVEYLIWAEGFSKEELLKVANALQPVAP